MKNSHSHRFPALTASFSSCSRLSASSCKSTSRIIPFKSSDKNVAGVGVRVRLIWFVRSYEEDARGESDNDDEDDASTSGGGEGNDKETNDDGWSSEDALSSFNLSFLKSKKKKEHKQGYFLIFITSYDFSVSSQFEQLTSLILVT